MPTADFLNNAPKDVVSSTHTLAWANSRLATGDLTAELTTLKEQPGRNIVIPGSPALVRSLLRDGMLDELSLNICPIVVGSGTRQVCHAPDQPLGEEVLHPLLEARITVIMRSRLASSSAD